MQELNDYLSSIENRLLDEMHSLRKMVQTLLPNSNRQRNSYDSYYDSNHVQQYPSNYDSREQRRYNNDDRYNSYNSRDRYYYENSRSDEYNRKRYDENSYEERRNSYEDSKQRYPTKKQQNFSTTTERSYDNSRKAPEVVAVPSHMLKSLDIPRERVMNKSAALPTSTVPPPTTIDSHEPLTSTKMEYIYHWKLDNFPKVFTVDRKSEVFSHVFNVKGLFLRIRAAWNQLDEESLILDIEHLANVDNIDAFEVEINDGLVFKEIADEKLFQYSFAIVDESKPNHDLISPIYWNTDSDSFEIRNSLVLLSNYMKNDSVLIKLIISF